MKQNSRFLLDTRVWIWMLAEPEKLSRRVSTILGDEKTELFLSVASVWEMSIKHRLGKLTFSTPPSQFIPEQLEKMNVRSIPIEAHHAIAAAELPDHHHDPFDRLILAQAILEKLTILSADKQFSKYDVDVVKP